MKSAAVLLTVIILAIAVQALPLSSLNGRVVDENGAGLGGARIEVYQGSALVKVISTSDTGYFSGYLEVGSYTLKITKDGYVPKTLTVMVRSGGLSLGEISLEKALKASSFFREIVVNPGGRISIPVSIANLGDAATTCTVNISAPLEAYLKLSGMEITSFILSPGESRGLTLEAAVPNAYGEYFVNITFISDKGVNASLSFKLTVREGPYSLLLSCDTPGKAYLPGDTAIFNVDIRNPFDETIYLNLSLIYPENWAAYLTSQSGERVTAVSLRPSGSTKIKVVAKIPGDAATGTYPLTVLASSSKVSDSIRLTVTVEKGEPVLSVNLDTPSVNAYSGSAATYEFEVSNIGTGDAVYDIGVEGLPEGYTYTIQDNKGNVLSSIYMPPQASRKLFLRVKVPYGEEPHSIGFNLTFAREGSVVAHVALTLNILGKYEIKYKTENFLLEMPVGGTAEFMLDIENSGASELTSVMVKLLSVPSGLNVTVEPDYIPSLKPGDTASFKLTVISSGDMNAGDYYVTLVIVSDQVDSESRFIRVSLYQSTETAYLGYALLAVAVIVLLVVYRRYGRR